MLYFVTYPGWDGHWHKYYNQAVCSELKRHGIEYLQIVTDYTSPDIESSLRKLQEIRSSTRDVWLFSMAQNPAIDLVEHRAGRKYGHIHGLTCFPFEPAVLQGVDLQENRRFAHYDGLFLSSRWSYDNAVRSYDEHAGRFVLTGFPMDYSVYEPYLDVQKDENLVAFNQRFSCERLPLIEIEVARQLISSGYEVWHLHAQDERMVAAICPRARRLREIGMRVGLQFVANATKEQYHQNLARAATVVTTSICDNLPVSLIEAIYLGAVPIAPDAMCFPEIVHRDNLYSPYELAQILRLVRCRPKRHHSITGLAKEAVVERYIEAMELT
ncbi:MAG: hypothetical protein R6U70_10970 [Bacillota bacterium]